MEVGGLKPVELNPSNWANYFWDREATDWMLPLFSSLARKYPKCQVGEIGTRAGTSTVAFLLGVAESGGAVYSMDLDRHEEAHQMISDFGLDRSFRFLHGDSKELEFPVDLDILYIDGDHSYAGVKADYERHVPRVKDGGIVLFHDTLSWPDVGYYVNSLGGYCINVGAGLGVLMPNGPRGFDATKRSLENAHQS